MSNKIDRLIPEILELVSQFDYAAIPEERKDQLDALSDHLRKRWNAGDTPCVNFICTHNSRRSQMAQVWGQTAAMVYDLRHVTCLSGGTEEGEVDPATIEAFRRAGFYVPPPDDPVRYNPEYLVYFSYRENPVFVYSKPFDHLVNTIAPFTAVMTCADADKACPVIKNSVKRFLLPYDDPQFHDGTPGEAQAYDASIRRIGTEMFHVFSNIREK